MARVGAVQCTVVCMVGCRAQRSRRCSREYMDGVDTASSALPRFGDQDLVVAALADLRDVRFGTIADGVPMVCDEGYHAVRDTMPFVRDA